MTNAFDAVCATAYNFALSYYYNVKVTYNLLGENGVLGKPKEYDDPRGMAAKIIYGFLSAPIVAVALAITNAFDAMSAGVYHFALSCYYNLKVTYNLLGENGILGKPKEYDDPRGMAAKIIYGFLSAPVVAVASAISNVFDVVCATPHNVVLSCYYNIKATCNLLAENGILGRQREFDDPRGLPAKILYGFLSLPVVVFTSVITNIFDAFSTVIYHFSLSCYYNIKTTFNLLGENGVFGKRQALDDPRSIEGKIIFGVLSSPVVGVVAAVTNIVDILGTNLKHLYLSIYHNLSYSSNYLLGEKGVMGEARAYADERPLWIRGIYGVLTLPPVALATLITNAIDLVGAYFKHWEITIKYPALLTSGVVASFSLAIPVFVLRKTVNGLYNVLVQPFVDLSHNKHFNAGRFVRGIVNTITLGLFSAITKLFKAVTGYSHRFGFSSDEIENKFRDASHQATIGTFDDPFGKWRLFARTAYGMRHSSEKIVKAYHNAYKDYVGSEAKPSMNGFFASEQYHSAKQSTKIREDERHIVEQVESHLKK